MKTGSQRFYSDTDIRLTWLSPSGSFACRGDAIWYGKTGKHWQTEQIDEVSRSPKLKPRLKRDMAIIGADTA
jgi:hypothetical protein